MEKSLTFSGASEGGDGSGERKGGKKSSRCLSCIIPRVQMFMWNACAHALPVKVNLVRRACMENAVGALCGEAAETTEHLLLYCREIQLTNLVR